MNSLADQSPRRDYQTTPGRLETNHFVRLFGSSPENQRQQRASPIIDPVIYEDRDQIHLSDRQLRTISSGSQEH